MDKVNLINELEYQRDKILRSGYIKANKEADKIQKNKQINFIRLLIVD